MNELTATTMAADTDAAQGHAWVDRTPAGARASTARKAHLGKRQRPSSHSRVPGTMRLERSAGPQSQMRQALHDQSVRPHRLLLIDEHDTAVPLATADGVDPSDRGLVRGGPSLQRTPLCAKK
jgi:hypothetical protein